MIIKELKLRHFTKNEGYFLKITEEDKSDVMVIHLSPEIVLLNNEYLPPMKNWSIIVVYQGKRYRYEMYYDKRTVIAGVRRVLNEHFKFKTVSVLPI